MLDGLPGHSEPCWASSNSLKQSVDMVGSSARRRKQRELARGGVAETRQQRGSECLADQHAELECHARRDIMMRNWLNSSTPYPLG